MGKLGEVLRVGLIAQFASDPRMDMDPVSGEELQALAKEVIDQPPEVIVKLKKILGL